MSDELVAFRIIESQGKGTANTVKKTKEKGILVKVFQWNFAK